jgi:hypothetical protein
MFISVVITIELFFLSGAVSIQSIPTHVLYIDEPFFAKVFQLSPSLRFPNQNPIYRSLLFALTCNVPDALFSFK